MQDENRDKNCDQNDNYNAERCRAATGIPILHHNRSVSHTGSCSFRVAVRPLYPDRASGYTFEANNRLMLAASGLALSLTLSLLALYRSRRATGSYYEYEVYGMTPAVHRRYAALSAAFAVFFAAALFVKGLPVTPVAGGYVIFMVFYLASFARGFGE